MHDKLFSYIWHSTRRQQLWILTVILASMPVTFLLLDLPKHIVNGPIQGGGFEQAGATERLFHLSFYLPGPFGGTKVFTLVEGYDFDRLGSLVALSSAFLVLVLLNGLFKLYINIYKGRLGEKSLQQLRYELFDRVLRFPIGEFRRAKPGEISTMIKDEVEPLGGFIGDAFVQPVFLGGQILTALAFILLQNVPLGLIALGLLALQAVVIPRLRRKQIEFGRQRQITARQLAGRISEVMEDIPSIRTNDTANYQRADIASRLTAIFQIRFALYRWKFFIKFLNNLLAQITPFLFYLLGGYFAIQGKLDIGQLVAVIAAYKDLPSPVKELIDWDQQRLDVEVKYRQVVEQFTIDGLAPPAAPVSGALPEIAGDLTVSGLSVSDFSGARLLDGLSFRMALTEIVAVVGPARGGAETLLEVLARLSAPGGGMVRFGGHALHDWPPSSIERRISYAGSSTYFPQSTIAEALLAGLRHGPPERRDGSAPAPGIIDSGGLDLDFAADWIDYAQAGVVDPDGLAVRFASVLRTVDLYHDVVRFGLNSRLAGADETVQQRFVQARQVFRRSLAEAGMAELVESFDPDRYNRQSSVAENLLFGTWRGQGDGGRGFASDSRLREVLRRLDLAEDLFEMGRTIARTVLEVFEGIAPDNPLLANLALVGADQLPVYSMALNRIGKSQYRYLDEADRVLFLELAFAYVEPRDRLGVLDGALEARIVTARHAIQAALGRHDESVTFHDPAAYNPAATIQDNILFGRIAHGTAEAEMRVQDQLDQAIDALDLRATVFDTGLAFDIGHGGRRLSSAQRQKLTLARALLRRPALLLAHRTLSTLDQKSQIAILDRVLALARGAEGEPFGVLAVLADSRFTDSFDRVLVLDNGRLVEDGTPEALRGKGGYLMKMVA
jgi:putative ABC transport system ATP-binding protein